MSLFKLLDNKEVQVKPSIDASRYDDGLRAVIQDGFDGFLSIFEYFELERKIHKQSAHKVSVNILTPYKYQWTSDAWRIHSTKLS